MSDPGFGSASNLAYGVSSPLSFALARRDAHTMDMVKEAIANENVLLAYQPVVQTACTGMPAFYEGLVRVLDPTGRVIPAQEFIHVIETTEYGRQIDCLALKMGLETLNANPGLRVSINMSARSIGYPRWRDTLDHGLRQGPTVGERLILEITESSAMVMPDTVQVFMAELQRKGITFALDDFGAGFTSFRYLRDFFFDIIKIDGQFIRDVDKDPDNQVLLQALVSIARQFEMFTVAEFVETAAEATFLIDSGVDCLQGYFFGAPSTKPRWVLQSDQLKTG